MNQFLESPPFIWFTTSFPFSNIIPGPSDETETSSDFDFLIRAKILHQKYPYIILSKTLIPLPKPIIFLDDIQKWERKKINWIKKKKLK